MSVPDHQINPPAEDPECDNCGGSGIVNVSIGQEDHCGYCHGLGYIERQSADDIAEAKAEERGDEARNQGGVG